VFRIVVNLRSSYSVFLELSRDNFYLYLVILIELELPRGYWSSQDFVDSTSHSNSITVWKEFYIGLTQEN